MQRHLIEVESNNEKIFLSRPSRLYRYSNGIHRVYSNILENYLPMKKRIAQLECEPYRGEEFFKMLKEEQTDGLIR